MMKFEFFGPTWWHTMEFSSIEEAIWWGSRLKGCYEVTFEGKKIMKLSPERVLELIS